MRLIHINLLSKNKKQNASLKRQFFIIFGLGISILAAIFLVVHFNLMKKQEKELKKQFEINVSQVLKKTHENNPEIPIYSHGLVSLNMQEANIRTVLQTLVDFKEFNLIMSDSVKGNITSHLKRVPWEQALNIILKTRGLDKRQVENVLWIAPQIEILEYERQELENKKQFEEFQPLHTSFIQIKYAKAFDIVQILKDRGNTLLSPQGNASVDVRTNTILVQDKAKQIDNIRRLIDKLDIPAKQVLIEARIVIVDKSFERDLGIRFGTAREDANHVSQENSPSTLGLKKRLNVDLPILPSSGIPATVGFALAKLGKDILLDLELSALESEGRGEIISSPRLVTANQQEAVIQSGEEIPYQQSTPLGATSIAFKKAVLSLRVTPQITPDDKIILNLVVNQDEPASQVFNGVPAIKTKEIQTKVLVDNGQTLVLGGIYKQAKRSDIKRVPVLGSLPVVGILFRSEATDQAREELLIFVTPKIITQSYENK